MAKKAKKKTTTRKSTRSKGGVLAGKAEPLDIDKYRSEAKRSGGGAGFFNVEEGANVVRIIPFVHDSKTEMAVVSAQHYGVGPEERSVVCPKVTSGDECPVCDLVAADPDEFGDQRARARWFFWVIDRNDEKTGLQVLGAGARIFKPVTELIGDPDVGMDLLNTESGYDVVITKTGSGKFGTRYSVRIKPKKTPVTVPAEVPDLFDRVRIRDADAINAILNGEDPDQQ